ncbi:hypothetical protein FWG95_01475 [Candidatus Saccharibacteria bacterium]|nr:hypothetical protein [Candidatus Saccharibacteria bacterium]
MKKWLAIALLAVVPLLGTVSSQPAMAATTTDATQINATVNGENIFNLTVNGETGPVETYNSLIHVSFQAVGEGLIEITDQDGNVLFTLDKTTPGIETINTDINLPAVGIYTLTTTITGPTNVASQSITVDYRALPIIPPGPGGPGGPGGGPGSPSTGFMIYVNGYAIPVIGVLFWLVLLTIVSGSIFFLVRNRKTRHAKSIKL